MNETEGGYITDEAVFGLTLSTRRDSSLGIGSLSLFDYECVIAGISIIFCRMTVKAQRQEPFFLRLFFALSLGFLAYTKKPYTLTVAIQLFSYAVPFLLVVPLKGISKLNGPSEKLVRLALIAISAAMSLLSSQIILSDDFFPILSRLMPPPVKETIFYLVPIEEMYMAYHTIQSFMDPQILHQQISQLFFVTFNIQVGMGYLGIEFLTREQNRRNELVRMDLIPGGTAGSAAQNGTDDKPSNDTSDRAVTMKQKRTTPRLEASRRFQRGAAPFIFVTAIPYMLQIIVFGNMNFFSYHCVLHDIHRAVRLNELFDHESHLVAMANDSATSPDAFAASMDVVVSTVYDFFNRKLFSLPKLLLLPGIIMRQPILVAQLTPLIFGSDFLKGRIMAFLTSNIERLKKEVKEVQSVRTKVEAFDMKNAELLQRSGVGATKFTQHQWELLTTKIQQMTFIAQFLTRTKRFFNFIQHHFVFSVMIDCALAQLIAVGKIVSADIFVFSRAIEDAVDTILMRSRAESELARMITEIEKLEELTDVWKKSEERSQLPCSVAQDPSSGITLTNLRYSRGSASVQVDQVSIKPGIYALTGANGSGKSTLFRVLMSCSSNMMSTDLPSSIVMDLSQEKDSTSSNSCGATADGSCEMAVSQPLITMPSSDVAEISQSFYWPLYSRPIDWIYQEHLKEDMAVDTSARRVAMLLQGLEFRQLQPGAEEGLNHTASEVAADSLRVIMDELLEEKEDWFSDLSGGQKSKVELVRKVFIQEQCPSVLLIDETLAPLDPSSKALVMSKLKAFCSKSVVIVIYHTDVMEREEGKNVECVPSNNFFGVNIHLENRTLNLRDLC